MALATSNVYTPPKPSYGQAVGGLFNTMFSPKTNPVSAIGSGVMGAVKGIGGLFSGQKNSLPPSQTPQTPVTSPSVSGVVNRTTPSPVMSTLKLPPTAPLASSGGISSFDLTPDQYAGVQKAQQTVQGGGVINPPNVNPNFAGTTGGKAGTKLPIDTSTSQTGQSNPQLQPNMATPPVGQVIVYDKTTGQPSYMPENQVAINLDKYTLTKPDQQPNQISGLGTPNADTSTYQGLIKQASEAQAAARNFNQNLTNAKTQVTQQGSDLPYQTGAQEGLQRTYGAQATALTQAGSDAALLASQAKPSPATYGQAVFNPLTGQYSGGGTGGENLDPQTLASQLAPLVASGQMNITDANSQMTGGVAGSTALRQAILKINPNFNFNLSASSASTQAQGQQIQTAATSANAVLDKLSTDFTNLPDWQKYGIPGTVGIGQAIGQFLGNDKLATYKSTLTDARAQVVGVLQNTGTPSGAEQTAYDLLPDNMTIEQLPAKIEAARTFMKQRLDAWVKSGGQQAGNTARTSGGTSTSGSSIWDWPK